MFMFPRACAPQRESERRQNEPSAIMAESHDEHVTFLGLLAKIFV